MSRFWSGDPRFASAQLTLLEALARSQTAVARMLESAADVSAVAGLPPALLREQLRVLANVQRAMIASVAGIDPPRMKAGGPPPAPWLHPGAGRGRLTSSSRTAGRSGVYTAQRMTRPAWVNPPPNP